jgi:hypothetical protein
MTVKTKITKCAQKSKKKGILCAANRTSTENYNKEWTCTIQGKKKVK